MSVAEDGHFRPCAGFKSTAHEYPSFWCLLCTTNVGSQAAEPHLEDGTTYYPLRPTRRGSNRPLGPGGADICRSYTPHRESSHHLPIGPPSTNTGVFRVYCIPANTMAGNAFSTRTGSALSFAFTPQTSFRRFLIDTKNCGTRGGWAWRLLKVTAPRLLASNLPTAAPRGPYPWM